MKISSIEIKGFRNFNEALINFNDSTLIIGANDIGKSNLLHALRIILDKSLSEEDIEPSELDFHIQGGETADEIEITIRLVDIKEDAVISVLKGHISDVGESLISYKAKKSDLSYQLFIGHSEDELEEINSRFYLRYVNLKYIESQRDLERFIRKEKKQLLKVAQQALSDDEKSEDDDLFKEISKDLQELNSKVSQLRYVDNATTDVNTELKKLAHHYSDYEVLLDTGAIQVNDFIDNLKLGAHVNGSGVMLGGDGRNNQILLALWKAKSTREHDLEHEVVFYVIEEPEAHLHPHQQRKLASYLIDELPGQTIISSHSPQIAVNFKPDSIIRLLSKESSTIAASQGCSDCIAGGYEDMNYRMSILPSETFFSNGVFLVEGPSEVLFYSAIAEQLNIDLDFYNLSILSVDGISFKIYTSILDALEIPWVMRTDNDISKVSKKDQWQYAGMNRCLKLADKLSLKHSDIKLSPIDSVINGMWENVSGQVNENGIYLSRVDLETDLVDELTDPILLALDKTEKRTTIEYLQKKKAIRMRALLTRIKPDLIGLKGGDLA